VLLQFSGVHASAGTIIANIDHNPNSPATPNATIINAVA